MFALYSYNWREVMIITLYLGCRFYVAYFSSHCFTDHWVTRIPSVFVFLLVFPGYSWETTDRHRYWNLLLVNCCAYSALSHQWKEIECEWSTCQSGLASYHLARLWSHILCLMTVMISSSLISNSYSPVSMNQKLLWHAASSGRNAATSLCQRPQKRP